MTAIPAKAGIQGVRFRVLAEEEQNTEAQRHREKRRRNLLSGDPGLPPSSSVPLCLCVLFKGAMQKTEALDLRLRGDDEKCGDDEDREITE